MSNFTPGPWSYEGPAHTIIVYGPEPEQRVCFMTSDGPTKANARLIAAAPELLAIAKAALAFIDCHVADPDLTEEMVHKYNLLKVQEPHAVIAKAEGR